LTPPSHCSGITLVYDMNSGTPGSTLKPACMA
jgi:hypothetical protein